jgi:parallel beta-helix repeat protein
VGDITGLTLINADTDQPIGALNANDVLDLATLPSRNLSIRADVSGTIGSVRFGLDDLPSYHIENAAPYVISGDRFGDVHAWTPTLGDHNVMVTPYSEALAAGDSGDTLSLNFKVVDSSLTTPTDPTPVDPSPIDPAPIDPAPTPDPTPIPNPTVPEAPSSLTSSGVTSSSVTLSWSDNSTSESGFIIERSGDGQVFLPLTDVGANTKTYTDNSVLEDSSYWYRVAAVNSVGISAYTAALPVKTPASTPTTIPTPTTSEIPAVTGKIIYVSPGQSIDAALDSASPGDHVVVKAGVYKESITISRSGEAGKPIVLRPETPGTVTIDATGQATALIPSGGTNIFISGLTISGANNALSGNNNAAVRTADGWTIQDCTIEKNAGGGLGIFGSNVTVRRVVAQDNGRYGIGGSSCKNLLVSDCITRRNNRVIGDSNGGGGKFTRLNGAKIENLQSYENGGPGLWLDINNINVTITGSEFHDNINIYKSDGSRKVSGDGIDIEISGMVVNKDETAVTGEGPVVLENSKFWNNEHDGILVYASRNVTLRNNTLNGDHIYLKDGGRLPWYLTKFTAVGNTITSGYIQADGAVSGNWQTRELSLDGTTFINCTSLYKWGGSTYKTLDSIRSALGFETNGLVK